MLLNFSAIVILLLACFLPSMFPLPLHLHQCLFPPLPHNPFKLLCMDSSLSVHKHVISSTLIYILAICSKCFVII